MKDWLALITEPTIFIINVLALIIIALGTTESFANGMRFVFFGPSHLVMSSIWLRYAHWLVAGLTFQLAADILETTVTLSWDAIGRSAAIALIRTFINYSLWIDLAEAGKRGDRDVACRRRS